MSNSTWPEGAMEDAIELAKIGVMPMKILQFLKSKFISYEFKHDAVKSFIYRWKVRGNIAPRPLKWNQEISQRAVTLVREGKGRNQVAEILNTEFPQYKFYKNDVQNHIFRVRHSTGDNTLKFAGKPPVDTKIKNDIKNLVQNTTMSSIEIATELGVTKGVVCGIIFRMRKKSGDDTIKAKGKSPEWKRAPKLAPARSRGVVQAINAAAMRAGKERKAERRLAMLNMKDFPNAVHLLERSEWMCPWPLWCDETPFSEKMFCGNAKEDGYHYCSGHCALAYDQRVAGDFRRKQGMGAAWGSIIAAGRAA